MGALFVNHKKTSLLAVSRNLDASKYIDINAYFVLKKFFFLDFNLFGYTHCFINLYLNKNSVYNNLSVIQGVKKYGNLHLQGFQLTKLRDLVFAFEGEFICSVPSCLFRKFCISEFRFVFMAFLNSVLDDVFEESFCIFIESLFSILWDFVLLLSCIVSGGFVWRRQQLRE